MKFKIKLWLVLTLLGIIGIASLLVSDLPLDNLPQEVRDMFPPETLRLLILANPVLILVAATILGTLLYDKVNLGVPILEKLLRKPNPNKFSISETVINGILLGLLAGSVILLITRLFHPYLPTELTDNDEIDLHIISRILYGGITEELLMRFGLMTLLVWIIYKITKKLTAPVYWIAIILSSFVFAMGHLPIVFQVVSEPTFLTYAYIISANSIGGVVFGYAYYKKGLETAFIAHAFTHITMVTLTSLIS